MGNPEEDATGHSGGHSEERMMRGFRCEGIDLRQVTYDWWRSHCIGCVFGHDANSQGRDVERG